MPNWIDIAVPVLVFITVVWGFSTGYWYALVLLISILVGLVIGARFDSSAATQVGRVLTSTGFPLLEALVFVVLTIIATGVTAGIVGWLLGFARPETRAARALPSAHFFGALFGLGFGAVLASVLLMAAYLGSKRCLEPVGVGGSRPARHARPVDGDTGRLAAGPPGAARHEAAPRPQHTATL